MTLLPSPDLTRRSVTRADAELFATQGRVLYVSLPATGGLWGISGVGPLPPELPAPWSRARDQWLSATVLAETMWSAAVNKAITKWAARNWTIVDSAKSERRTKMAQQYMLTAQDGAGWVSFLARVLRDFLLTDNGAFVEIVRANSSAGSRILGLMQLDSMRCWRTGDRQYPVIYEDLMGGMHVLRDYQVITLVDMESSRAEARGTGLCAASRAYQTIHKLANLEQYVTEKISGTRPKEIHLVNGISDDQVDDAISVAAEQRRQQGNTRYQGVVVVAARKMDANLGGYRIPIAEVPDGFNAKEERDNAYLKIANALGVPLQDIQPLSGQGLGTGTQSVILAEAAEGEGLAVFGKQWEHAANQWVLPSSTTFSWSANDLRDQKARAEVGKLRAETRKMQIETGEITTQQAQQLAADAGDIPDTFLTADETPQDELTDTEKPVEEAAAEDAPTAPTPVPVVPVTKTIPEMHFDGSRLWTLHEIGEAQKAARLTVATLLDADAIKAARELAGEVRRAA